jgi:site-specific DNA recombinase
LQYMELRGIPAFTSPSTFYLQIGTKMELAGVAGSIEDFCERVRGGLADATFEQKRKLVELLIDRVIVTGEEVEIRYVIPTDPSSEQVRFCHLRSDYVYHPPVAS